MLKSIACMLLFCLVLVSGSLVNEKVKRTINLKTNVVRITTDLQIQNTGNAKAETYEMTFSSDDASQISDISAVAGSNGKKLAVSLPKQSKDGVTYKITLKPAIASGETENLVVTTALVHNFTPFPTEIKQSEDQYLLYKGNMHFYSPYETKSVTTDVKLPSSNVESHTESDELTVKGNVLSYGPFKNIKPFTSTELRVHYVNNYPMMTLTEVVKEVEVSHWGHLSFEEHIDMAHTGAKLKGGFSRLDFQRDPSGSPSNFRLITSHVPASAYGLYYRDIIGNISTSRVRVEEPSKGDPYTNFELLPRYVMFGGWKTKFYFGYVAPLGEFLGLTKDGTYTLRVPFGTSLVKPVVDKLTTRVILPEGANNIKVGGIRDISETRSLRKTYLDTKGRPVISLSKTKVVGDNSATLVVTYNFPSSALYYELLMLIAGFATLFAIIIFMGRFRLRIGKDSKDD